MAAVWVSGQLVSKIGSLHTIISSKHYQEGRAESVVMESSPKHLRVCVADKSGRIQSHCICCTYKLKATVLFILNLWRENVVNFHGFDEWLDRSFVSIIANVRFMKLIFVA